MTDLLKRIYAALPLDPKDDDECEGLLREAAVALKADESPPGTLEALESTIAKGAGDGEL